MKKLLSEFEGTLEEMQADQEGLMGSNFAETFDSDSINQGWIECLEYVIKQLKDKGVK